MILTFIKDVKAFIKWRRFNSNSITRITNRNYSNNVIANGNRVIGDFSGGYVNLVNGRIVINGLDITPDSKTIHIEINGNVDTLIVDCCNEVKITGSTNYAEIGSGSLHCDQVTGDVKAGSGGVTCNNIQGNVNTGSGSVKAGKIAGTVKTGSGSVYRKN